MSMSTQLHGLIGNASSLKAGTQLRSPKKAAKSSEKPTAATT